MASRTRTLILLLLAGLMVCKASAFHFCDHDHDQQDGFEHCELCDLAIEIQQADAIPVLEGDDNIQQLPPKFIQNPLLRPIEVTDTENLSYRLYGRPPPVQ